MQPDGDQWQPQGDTVLRTVRKAKLYELGPVVFPAYPSTSVGARAEARSLDYVLDLGRPAATPDNWRARTEARLKALEAHLATSTEAVRFGVP